MFQVVSLLGVIFRVVARPFLLIRDGQSDLDGTYPEHVRGTGQQAAVVGSMFVTMSGNCWPLPARGGLRVPC